MSVEWLWLGLWASRWVWIQQQIVVCVLSANYFCWIVYQTHTPETSLLLSKACGDGSAPLCSRQAVNRDRRGYTEETGWGVLEDHHHTVCGRRIRKQQLRDGHRTGTLLATTTLHSSQSQFSQSRGLSNSIHKDKVTGGEEPFGRQMWSLQVKWVCQHPPHVSWEKGFGRCQWQTETARTILLLKKCFAKNSSQFSFTLTLLF